MLIFCEKAMRGDLNGTGEKRFMKANNHHLPDYDEKKTINLRVVLGCAEPLWSHNDDEKNAI